jgi:hypothetical protein
MISTKEMNSILRRSGRPQILPDTYGGMNVVRRAVSKMKCGDSITRQLVRINPGVSRITIELPGLNLKSLVNLREHRHASARRAAEQRSRARNALATVTGGIPPLPVSVRIVRVYAGRGQPLDVSDNLQISAKHLVDGIADAYGCDDADPRISWLPVEQRKGERAGVELVIESRKETT